MRGMEGMEAIEAVAERSCELVAKQCRTGADSRMKADVTKISFKHFASIQLKADIHRHRSGDPLLSRNLFDLFFLYVINCAQSQPLIADPFTGNRILKSQITFREFSRPAFN